MFCHTNHEAPGRRIPLLEARCHLKPYSSVQFSPVQSSCSIRPWSREHQGAARSNRGHWGAPGKKHPIKLITHVLPHQTHHGTENTLFLPKKTPEQINYHCLPHQTHLGAKNALFLPKKTPDQINYPCFATPNAPRKYKMHLDKKI